MAVHRRKSLRDVNKKTREDKTTRIVGKPFPLVGTPEEVPGRVFLTMGVAVGSLVGTAVGDRVGVGVGEGEGVMRLPEEEAVKAKP